MRLSKFRQDSTKEREGVWAVASTGRALSLSAIEEMTRPGGPLLLKVCRWNKPEFQAALLVAAQKLKQQGDEEDETALVEHARHMAELVAEHILVDWRNMETDEDEVITYTVERAVDLLCDPDYGDFLEMVGTVARKRENYAYKAESRDEGNSPTGLTGSSDSPIIESVTKE